ncbi:zinc-binding dehydrogenase [Aquihabitans sp. McL0605]|uniref:zinc-binding dehydrogenase n=1 Tax=Aquihabitans sp. McL0605 TaxID=3415671 RepID=UPI003CFA3486
MHAIRLHEFGPAHNLRYEEVPTPDAGPGQVRIAVGAAGVHLVDTTIREGRSGGPFPLPDLPMTPGREVAGVVDQVGPGADPALLGRRVVAHLGIASGGYAERAVTGFAALQDIPDGATDEQAVAMIGTGRTTMGILEQSDLTADDVVLVTAAAGGIGSLLVQAGRQAGATVVGVAGGPEKAALVAGLGADVAIDYLQPDWVDQVRDGLGGRGVTLAFDSIGGDTSTAILGLMAPGGRIRVYGWSAGEYSAIPAELLEQHQVTSAVVLGAPMMERPGGIRGLEAASLAALAAGRLVPVINEPFALRDAAKAHEAIVSRATVGKVVLIP